jgi:hypothetical protein
MANMQRGTSLRNFYNTTKKYFQNCLYCAIRAYFRTMQAAKNIPNTLESYEMAPPLYIR